MTVSLPQRALTGTGVHTTPMGFGCAGLDRLPRERSRQALLAAVYDAGIRHFDVAPMYGLGLAEAELGRFLHGRRQSVTIATKFGIEPSPFGHRLSRLQRPLRQVLSTLPRLNSALRGPHNGTNASLVSKLLYRVPGYSRTVAQVSLQRSLRLLQTDYIDIFLLHDPSFCVTQHDPDLIVFLEQQRSLGNIRSWGVTASTSSLLAQSVTLDLPLLQYRDDIFTTVPEILSPGRVTFGALARTLPILRRFLAQSPLTRTNWSTLLDIDIDDPSQLPCLLLASALIRNAHGPTLFTTTRATHVQLADAACELSQHLTLSTLTSLSDLASQALRAHPLGPLS